MDEDGAEDGVEEEDDKEVWVEVDTDVVAAADNLFFTIHIGRKRTGLRLAGEDEDEDEVAMALLPL